MRWMDSYHGSYIYQLMNANDTGRRVQTEAGQENCPNLWWSDMLRIKRLNTPW
jgi:hypothetical protein